MEQSSGVAVGFATHLGWACCTAIHLDCGRLSEVRTYRIETAPTGDREALEPFHVAGGFQGLDRVPPPTNPAAIVERGLVTQLKTAHASLLRILSDLDDWPSNIIKGAVITGRGRQPATLEKTLRSHAQIHIAEGNAVRESIRQACTKLGMQTIDVDGRSMPDHFSQQFGKDESQLKLYAPQRGAWRKEERQCAMAAWLTFAP